MSSERAGLDLLQLFQRDVDRVVERGGAVDVGAADRLLERGGVVGETLQDADLAVEVDDFDDVFLAQPAGEADRRFLRGAEPLVHAGAGVEQDGQRDRLLHAREERHGLLGAVLEDLEVRLLEIGDVLGALHDRDVERDQIDAAAEALFLRDRQCGRAHDRREREGEQASHLVVRLSGAGASFEARTVTPGFDTETSSFSGGINDSGREYVTTYWLVISSATASSRSFRPLSAST